MDRLGIIVIFAVCVTLWAIFGSTAAPADTIEKINQRVNWQVLPTPREYSWDVNWKHGDCKTYVADKRALLLESGVDPKRMTVWLVHTETGHLHAVLVIYGHRVLDNREEVSMERSTLQAIGYQFEMPIDPWASK